MATVQITVGGTDVTADVVFEMTRFKTLVNGQPGEATMRVRDLGSTYSFTEGSDWLLAINGDAAFRGYVTQAKRVYVYPAGDVADSGLERFWDLQGTDLNVLFQRRVVFDTSDPTNVTGTQFPPATADTVAITELLDNWLDLSSDDLDTTSGIVGVGDLDPEQPTRAWSGGWYWGDAMGAIAMIPAAIYYLRPEMGSPRGTLVYCDVDVPDAPFGLSDTPNGTTTRGFRESEIIADGTSLANDILAWGMGYGSQSPVFKRLESSSSQTAHGLWQQGVVRPGVYKQGTIDRIADSILNGSPESKRGAKNDRPAVQLVTYEPGLLAGHKVAFSSSVWGYSDVIPVRQMEVSFETPTDPRYEVILSHEIDTPWGLFDLVPLPEFSFPPINICPDPPCIGGWPPPVTDCGITDAFNRSSLTSWGTSDAGIDWTWSSTGTVSVDGDMGLMHVVSSPNTSVSERLDYSFTSPIEAEVLFTCDNDLGDLLNVLGGNEMVVAGMSAFDDSGLAKFASVSVSNFQTLTAPFKATFLRFFVSFPSLAFDNVPCPIGIIGGSVYHLKFLVTPSQPLQAKVWLDGDPEPASWTASALSAPATTYTHFALSMKSQRTSLNPMTTGYNDLDITGVNRCTVLGVAPTSGGGSLPTGTTGFGCEYPTRSSSTLYTTGSSFQPQTTFVWRDGLFQRRGTDYTENSGNHSITFNDAVDSTSVIRMCYFAEVTGT